MEYIDTTDTIENIETAAAPAVSVYSKDIKKTISSICEYTIVNVSSAIDLLLFLKSKWILFIAFSLKVVFIYKGNTLLFTVYCKNDL